MPLPPSATGNYKFRVKVKSLPPQQVNSQSIIKRTSLIPTHNDETKKIFQCKYCSFISHWSKDITRHQLEIHPNYPPHILRQDNEINNNNNNQEQDDETEHLSAFLIDPVRAFGEVIDTVENTNGSEYEEMEGQDEEMLMEHDIDDDEDDA